MVSIMVRSSHELESGSMLACIHIRLSELSVSLQRTMGKFRGVPAPSFITLMDSVAMLQRKPVRAR